MHLYKLCSVIKPSNIVNAKRIDLFWLTDSNRYLLLTRPASWVNVWWDVVIVCLM